MHDWCDYPNIVGCVIDPPSTVPTVTSTTSTTTVVPTTTSSSTTVRPSSTTAGSSRPPTTTSQSPSSTTVQTTLSTSTNGTTTAINSSSSTSQTTIKTSSEPGTQSPSSTTSQPPVYNCSGLPDGNYQHPTNCSKFISCVAGEYAYEMDCPAGLHYDPSTDQCDYPEVAGCDPKYASSTTQATSSVSPSTSSNPTPTPTTTAQSTTSQTPSPSFNCSGLEDGNYKHPTDCSKFIACVAGQYAYEMQCPSGLYYDPIYDICDYPENVDCENSPQPTTSSPPESSTRPSNATTGSTETTTNTTISTSTQTPLPTNATTTTDPDACDHDCQYVGIDCHHYYSCINFTRKEYHECSYEMGLAFNPELLVCDRIENVRGCGGSTSTELPTTPEAECGCVYKPHETDCGKYYFCQDSCRNSSCQLMVCPGDLLWSVDFYGDGSSHQQCTLPERATCASKDSGSAYLEFSCFRKGNGLYRNENDCRSYWKCNDGIALLYACPGKFIYNPKTESCDFPGKALRFCEINY